MSKIFEVKFANARDVKAQFEALGDAGIKAVAKAIYKSANQIMTDSKKNYVPVRTGVLRSSGTVTHPKRSGASVTVELGYGGAASAYALAQHERLDYRHKKGQAKYLELPAIRHRPEIASNVMHELREAFAKATKRKGK